MIETIRNYFKRLIKSKSNIILPQSQNIALQHFDDLSKLDLPRIHSDILVLDNDKITEFNRKFVKYVRINDKPYYQKDFRILNGHSFAEYVSSKFYNDIGMSTPPMHLLLKDIAGHQILSLISQDVKSALPNKDIIHAYQLPMLFENLSYYSKELNSRWEVLFDDEVKGVFLEYLTTDCFDQLITMFLIDDLRTERDRHTANYFLYKSQGKDKFEGVIPIDNERTYVVLRGVKDKESFKSFIEEKYSANNPLDYKDHLSVKERVEQIINLIESGKLSKKQIELLKRAVNYDLPKTISNLNTNSYTDVSYPIVYSAFSYLWEYLNNTLDRHL